MGKTNRTKHFIRLNENELNLIRYYLIEGVMGTAIANVLGYARPFIAILNKGIKKKKQHRQAQKIIDFVNAIKEIDGKDLEARNNIIVKMIQLGIPVPKIAEVVGLAESSLRSLISKNNYIVCRREYSVKQAKILREQLLEMQAIRQELNYKKMARYSIGYKKMRRKKHFNNNDAFSIQLI